VVGVKGTGGQLAHIVISQQQGTVTRPVSTSANSLQGLA